MYSFRHMSLQHEDFRVSFLPDSLLLLECQKRSRSNRCSQIINEAELTSTDVCVSLPDAASVAMAVIKLGASAGDCEA